MDKEEKVENRKGKGTGRETNAQRLESGSFYGKLDDDQAEFARHRKGGGESERGRDVVSGGGEKVRRRERRESSESESTSDPESDRSRERGRNSGNRRKGKRVGEQVRGKLGKEREARRSESESETDSDASDLSRSDLEADHARKKQKDGGKRSVRKEEGRTKGRDKKLVGSDSEDSEGSALDRRKRRQRSRDRKSSRSARTRDRPSNHSRKRRRKTESESGSSSESDDRRERKRRKRRKQAEREERSKRRKKDRKGRAGQEGKERAAELEGEGNGVQPEKPGANSQQEAARRAAEEAKRAMRQNAEVARARLAGEVEHARAQQMALQNQFGAVDQRAVKKLNAEKRKLKSMLKASHKLEALEAKEAARMDAFRVAMGLPTAEAQRQAEWRAEATQQAALLHAMSAQEPLTPRRTLGPQLPSSKPKATH